MTVESDSALEAAAKANPAIVSALAENSVSPAPAKKKAAPGPVKSPSGAVIGKADTDEVLASRLGSDARKSLSIYHLQRRLRDLGYSEAAAEFEIEPGKNGALTRNSVSKWQEDNDFPVGALTHGQIRALFDGDPNVTVVLDTPELPSV